MKQTLGNEGDPCQYILYHDDYGEEKHSAFHINFDPKKHFKTRSKKRGWEEKRKRERKGAG